MAFLKKFKSNLNRKRNSKKDDKQAQLTAPPTTGRSNVTTIPVPGPPAVSSSDSSLSSAWTGVGVIRWINLVAFIVNVCVSYLIGVAGLYGKTNAEVSETFPTLITPADWAFAIWSIIFGLQAIWVTIQFSPVLSESIVSAVTTVNCYYVPVVLTQCAWVFTFSSEWVESAAVVLLLLVFNLFIVVRSLAVAEDTDGVLTYILTKLPFSIHFGWVLTASIVNVNLALVAQGFPTDYQYLAALISVGVLSLLGLLLICMSGFVAVPLTMVYALLGIFLRQDRDSESLFSESEVAIVEYATVGAACVLALSVLFSTVLRFSTQTSGDEPISTYSQFQDGAGRL